MTRHARLRLGLAAIGLLFAVAPGVRAADVAWKPTLEEGLAAAKTSGKAVLVVTLWKTGV